MHGAVPAWAQYRDAACLHGHVLPLWVQADGSQDGQGDQEGGDAAHERQPAQLLEGGDEHQRQRRSACDCHCKVEGRQAQDTCAGCTQAL